MPLETISVKGKLEGDETKKKFTFNYELGNVQTIGTGRWEIAIASVAILFGQGVAWNSIFEISTNYIDSVVPSQTGTVRKPMTLTFLKVKGSPGEKVLLGFKCRDFFEITTASRTLHLYWEELELVPPPVRPPRRRSAEATVLLLLRRVQ